MFNRIASEISQKNLSRWLLTIFGISVLITLGALILYLWMFHGKISADHDKWGEFGDFFGGTVNPLLSFFSLIALLLTIAIQSKEQERSLISQKRTEGYLEEQKANQAKQQFERTFFSLLDQHNNILEKISARNSYYSNNGSDLNQVSQWVFCGASGPVTSLQAAKKALERKNSLCGHYFRNLYQILKFVAIYHPHSKIGRKFLADDISNATVGDDEKMYSNIVRSFLSYEVTQLLAVNCYCESNEDIYWKYKLLVERYELLEHMPFYVEGKENSILVQTINHYNNNAFGDSVFLKKVIKN